MSETEQNIFSYYPCLRGYIAEMEETGNKPVDWTGFISCLEESLPLKPVSLKKKSLKERKKAFADTLVPHVEIYGRDMILAFYEYFTENNVTGKGFRQEREKSWDLTRRLKTWANNNKVTKRSMVEKEQPMAGRMTGTTIVNSLKNFG